MTEEEEMAADAVMIADLQIIAACGSSYYSSAAVDSAMVAADVAVAMTAACGSSFSYAAAVVSATADVETDAANSSFTLFPI